MTTLARRMAGAWDRFWFQPMSTASLALFRIGLGLVAALQLVALAPNVLAFFGPDGVAPTPPPGDWSVLSLADTDAAVIALFVLTLLSAVAVTVGWHTRVAAIVLAVGLHSFMARTPGLWTAGDYQLRTLALFLAFAPSGAALSLDRLRTAPGRFWEFPLHAPWALRLIQIQLSVVYLASVLHKLATDQWRDGTAVSYALRLDDLVRFPFPDFITQTPVISQIMTWTTLEAEAALGVLIWVRVARPYVLALGVALHLGMHYAFSFGLFAFIIMTMYLTFIPPATAERVVLTLRDRLGRLGPGRLGPGRLGPGRLGPGRPRSGRVRLSRMRAGPAGSSPTPPPTPSDELVPPEARPPTR